MKEGLLYEPVGWAKPDDSLLKLLESLLPKWTWGAAVGFSEKVKEVEKEPVGWGKPDPWLKLLCSLGKLGAWVNVGLAVKLKAGLEKEPVGSGNPI